MTREMNHASELDGEGSEAREHDAVKRLREVLRTLAQAHCQKPRPVKTRAPLASHAAHSLRAC